MQYPLYTITSPHVADVNYTNKASEGVSDFRPPERHGVFNDTLMKRLFQSAHAIVPDVGHGTLDGAVGPKVPYARDGVVPSADDDAVRPALPRGSGREFSGKA